jgi:hypothetical protein
MRFWGIFIIGLGWGLSVETFAQHSYREAFDDRGDLRPPYQRIRDEFGFDPTRPNPAMAHYLLSEGPLDDNQRILPIPLILEDAELEFLWEAVRQRGLALWAFVADYLLDGDYENYRDRGAPPPELMDQILKELRISRELLDELWDGRGENSVRFVYGPDLIRDPSGRWMVMEDNIGAVGGLFDFDTALNAYLSKAIGLPRLVQNVEPSVALEMFGPLNRYFELKNVLDRFGHHSRFHPFSDAEVYRTYRRLHSRFGSLKLNDPFPETPRDRDLLLLNLWDGMEQRDFREVMQVRYSRSNLELLNSPGIEVLGHKALLPFTEWMIRHYLHEEPMIRTVPSTLIRGITYNSREIIGSSYDHERMRENLEETAMRASPFLGDVLDGDSVVKSGRENQGMGVFFTREARGYRLPALAEKMARAARDGDQLWIRQDRIQPSVLGSAGASDWESFSVNLRFHGIFSKQGGALSPIPWGRAQANASSSLNNISQGGMQLPVFSSRICRERVEAIGEYYSTLRNGL